MDTQFNQSCPSAAAALWNKALAVAGRSILAALEKALFQERARPCFVRNMLSHIHRELAKFGNDDASAVWEEYCRQCWYETGNRQPYMRHNLQRKIMKMGSQRATFQSGIQHKIMDAGAGLGCALP